MEYYGGFDGKDKQDGYVYDVKIKGLDANFWANVIGTPTVSNGTIVFNVAEASSYILHEFSDIEFFVTVPAAPTSGDVRQIGLFAPTAKTFGAVWFDITGAVFSAKVADNSGNITSVTIPWVAGWTNTAVAYRIKWLPDGIQFLIGKVSGGVITYTLLATIASPVSGLPYTALPITINNGNADNMSLAFIECRKSAGIV